MGKPLRLRVSHLSAFIMKQSKYLWRSASGVEIYSSTLHMPWVGGAVHQASRMGLMAFSRPRAFHSLSEPHALLSMPSLTGSSEWGAPFSGDMGPNGGFLRSPLFSGSGGSTAESVCLWSTVRTRPLQLSSQLRGLLCTQEKEGDPAG